MKLNGITCLGYNRTPQGFVAVLKNTTQEEILGINSATIQISADDGVTVEAFVGLSQANSIRFMPSENQYEAFFPNETGGGKRLAALEAENEQLKIQMKTLAQTVAMMQIGGTQKV